MPKGLRIAVYVCVAIGSLQVARAAEFCPGAGEILRGTVNRGGYEFEYESFSGDRCRGYGIRNKPGKPMTPVKWSSGDLVFIDTNLPACGRHQECEWSTRVERSYAANQSKTTLGFGINRDEFTEQVPAIVEAKLAELDVPRKWKVSSASFSGAVADASGKARYVKMSFDPAGFDSHGDLAISLSATQFSTKTDNRRTVQISWSSAEKVFFTEDIKYNERYQWTVVVHDASTKFFRPSGAILSVHQDGKLLAAMSTPLPMFDR
jgi:hypothetical protein